MHPLRLDIDNSVYLQVLFFVKQFKKDVQKSSRLIACKLFTKKAFQSLF